MKEEFLDILNEKGELTGESKSYVEVHKKGFIHRTVHVWIINSEKKLLLQKRSSDRQAYPDFWDISAAGHISAGQTSLEAAQRETKEELGLFIPLEKFQYLFSLEEHIILNQGTYINNEFQDVYLVQLDKVSPEIKLTDGEVSDVKWISIDEFKLLIAKENVLVPHMQEHNQLLEYLTSYML